MGVQKGTIVIFCPFAYFGKIKNHSVEFLYILTLYNTFCTTGQVKFQCENIKPSQNKPTLCLNANANILIPAIIKNLSV